VGELSAGQTFGRRNPPACPLERKRRASACCAGGRGYGIAGWDLWDVEAVNGLRGLGSTALKVLRADSAVTWSSTVVTEAVAFEVS
jgi:hypothetical protein